MANSPLTTPRPTGRTLGSCPSCGSERVVRLGIELTDGTPVVFTSCRACEARNWQAPEGELDVVDVLQRSRKPGVGRVPERVS